MNDDKLDYGPFFGLLSVAYILAFGLMLVQPFSFWDDVALPQADIFRMFGDAGYPWLAWYHYALLASGAPRLISVAIVFLSFFLSGIFLFLAIERLAVIGRTSSFAIALISTVAPLNFARFTQITSPAAIHFCAFTGGLLVAVTFLSRRTLGLRFAALILFAIAFLHQSFLPIYVAIFGLGAAFIGWDGSIAALPRNFGRNLIRHLDFLLLPFVVFAAHQAYFPSAGNFADYNLVRLADLIGAVTTSPIAAFWAFLEPFELFRVYGIRRTAGLAVLVFVILAITTKVFFARPMALLHLRDGLGTTLSWLALLASVGLFVAAVYPYLVVGEWLHRGDWSSRHQLVTQIAAGPLIFFLSRCFLKPTVAPFVLATIVSLFISFNAWVYFSYLKDGHTQNALLASLRSAPLVGDASTIWFDERRIPNRTQGRTIRYYEMTHLLASAFPSGRRLGIPCSKSRTECLAIRERILAESYRRKAPERFNREGREIELIVTESKHMGGIATLTLTGLWLTNQRRYWNEVGNYIDLTTKPITE